MAISRPRYQKKRKRRQTNKTGSKSKFLRGFYIPKNPEKYRQPADTTMNSQQYPEFRSSWEKKFYTYCDLNDEIDWWTTEPLAIQYISPKDGRQHRYFPDLLISKNNKKYLIEIKPASQCQDPINIAKWTEAERFCDLHNLEFIVLTEKELGI